MEFCPLRQKKRNHRNLKQPPALLPLLENKVKINAKFLGFCAEISGEDNNAYGNKLHKCGCFGQLQQDSKTLLLSLEETFFLAYFLQVLAVKSEYGEMTWRQILEVAIVINPNFVDNFAAYLYLRSKGWIVKSGIKFGGNFLIYKTGPNFYHASFVVLVTTEHNNYAAKDIKGSQRVAETANKDILLLNISKPADFNLSMLSDFSFLKISETIVRRFHFTSFVQQNNN